MGLSYKAGRCFRRDETNFVDPSPEKGTLSLGQEDGLLHVFWKARPSGTAELDLIVFEGDAVFSKVSQSTDDNVYALTFESSQEKHFFWFQAQGADYETQASYINQMIADPSFVPPPAASSSSNAGPSTAASLSVPASGLPPTTPAQQSTSSLMPAAPNPTRTVGFDLGTAGSSSGYSPAQLEQLRAMLEAQVGSAGESASDSDARLQDILTPQLLTPLFSSPELLRSLVPSLPSDLPVSSPPTAAEMTAVVESAQFQEGVRGLDRALRTGMLGGLVQGLGLPESAGTSVEAFLKAIGEQAGGSAATEDEGGAMETD